jgi:hypothetical protein
MSGTPYPAEWLEDVDATTVALAVARLTLWLCDGDVEVAGYQLTCLYAKGSVTKATHDKAQALLPGIL